MYVAWNGNGVSMIDLALDEATFLERLTAATGRPAFAFDDVPATLRARISRRIAGDRRADVPLDWRGRGAFERAVWAKALEIPRGEVRPYEAGIRAIHHKRAPAAGGYHLPHHPVVHLHLVARRHPYR
jgi:O6-methylguanine-DNA--protein-cysteine methyltransferase